MGQREYVTEGEYSQHTMIALYPDVDVCDRLVVDGGLVAADLHCTVAYTGLVDQVDYAALRAAVEDVLAREPIAARISGYARFSGATVDDGDVLVALVDSAALETLRRDLVDALATQGVELDRSHGFTAHITLAKLAADDPGPVPAPWRLDPIDTTFTQLTLKYGDEYTPYGFQQVGSPAERAKQAYGCGWAASGGPLTPRVRAGYAAAVGLVESGPDDPGVWEATLRLGHLEGTWAAIFDRRDALHSTTAAQALKAWTDLVDGLDLTTVVDDAQDAAAAVDLAEHRAAVIETVSGYILAELRTLPDTPGWQVLRNAVVDAITDAHAEGQTDAAALSADRAGMLGFDYAAAHADARATLEGRDDLVGAADVALQAGLTATARAAGRSLVAGIVEGLSPARLVDRVRDVLKAGAALVAELVHAVDTAFAAAMWSLYQRAGFGGVQVVTVGDSKVCPACTAAEDHGTYAIFDAPLLPLHYGCRCVLDSVALLPESLFASYALAGL